MTHLKQYPDQLEHPGENDADYEELDEEEVEEEEEQEDEQINMRMFGIHQALPIPDGEPDWDSGPPETAEEYLRRVRAEAAACPRVVRVEFDQEAHAAKQRARASAVDQQDNRQHRTSTSNSSQAVATTGTASTSAPASASVAGYVSRLLAAGILHDGPEWAQPSPQWVRELVSDFRDLRQWLAQASTQHAQELSKVRLPHVRDVTAWDRICFGIVRPPHTHGRQAHEGMFDNPGPDHTLDTAPAVAVLSLNPGLSQQPLSDPQPQSEDQPPQPLCPAAFPQPGIITSISVQNDGTGLAAGEPDEQREVHGGGGAMSGAAASGGDLRCLSGPVLSTVICIDQVTVGALLQRCVERLESAISLTDRDAQWMFALAAVLEKPAHSDVVAALRCLTRRVLLLRAGLGEAGDPQLPRLNTLAVVAGAYFAQDEKLLRCVMDMDLP